jgi:hypothetical protein
LTVCITKQLIITYDWKFAEEYDPATYDVYGFEAIPSFAKSLEQTFPKVHIVNAAVWNVSGKEVSISIDPDKKNSNNIFLGARLLQTSLRSGKTCAVL